MRLYERHGVWYVETYYYDPRTHKRARVRRSTGVKVDGRSSRRAAESVARGQIGDIASVGSQTKSITVADSIIGLVRSLERAGRSDVTIGIVGQKANNIYRVIGGKTMLSAISLATLEKYADTRLGEGAHRGTVHREIRTLRQAWSTAHRSGLVDSEPPAMPALGTVYTPRERWLPKDEVVALLDILPEHWREQVIMYLHLGIRASEIYRITPTDVDFGSGEVRIRGTKTAGADRMVPMTPEVRAILLKAVNRDPMFRSWTHRDYTLKHACEKAQIARCSLNDFRRTYATEMARAGVPMHVLMRLMGHTSTKMLEKVYTQVASDDRRSAAEKLPRYSEALSQMCAENVVPLRSDGRNGRHNGS